MANRRDSESATKMDQIRLKRVAFQGQKHGSNAPLLTSESERERKPGTERNRGPRASARRHRSDYQDGSLVETRPSRHRQMFRRPRALHYSSLDNDTVMSPDSIRSRSHTTSLSATNSGTTEQDAEERSSDNIPKVRSRLDLFVDLIWVGIIANLSGNFGDQAFSDSGVSIGIAVVEFTLLFITIFRVWDNLRVYTSSFFVDDMLQRQFTVWILILAVIYGINAPFAYNATGRKNSMTFLILIYITTKVSFLAADGFQAAFIPFLRRKWLFQLVATVVTIGIWVAAVFVPFPGKLILLIIANSAEHPVAIFLASPVADRLLTTNMKRNPDVDHWVERHEGFFIIILGEGVFRLIDGSPSGLGLNAQTGTVLQALLIYYVLHWLYFNGDQSLEYVHALKRTWWKPVMWQLFHITMFGALLLLDASVLFLLKNSATSISATVQIRDDSSSDSGTDTADVGEFISYALWTASFSLSITIGCMTGIALLNRPLDPPDTLVLNNRLLRIGLRLPIIIIVMCLPLIEHLSAGTWCAITVCSLYSVFLWEYFCGLEKNWTVFEKDESA